MNFSDITRPGLFKGKRVLVVGLGNTGADTIECLREYASKVYISHAHGAYIVCSYMAYVSYVAHRNTG